MIVFTHPSRRSRFHIVNNEKNRAICGKKFIEERYEYLTIDKLNREKFEEIGCRSCLDLLLNPSNPKVKREQIAKHEEKRNKVIALLEQGKSTKDIVTELSIGPKTVSLLRRHCGLPEEDKRVDKFVILKKLIDSDDSYEMIAKQYNCGSDLVNRVAIKAHKLGFTLHPSRYERRIMVKRPKSMFFFKLNSTRYTNHKWHIMHKQTRLGLCGQSSIDMTDFMVGTLNNKDICGKCKSKIK